MIPRQRTSTGSPYVAYTLVLLFGIFTGMVLDRLLIHSLQDIVNYSLDGLLGAFSLGLLAVFLFFKWKEKTRSELLLRESEARFRGIIENGEAAYFRMDKNGCYQDVNQAFLRLYGEEQATKILQRPVEDVHSLADARPLRQLLSLLLSGKEVAPGELARREKDGTVGWHTISVHPVLDHGVCVGMEGFLIDTTALRRARNDFFKLFESMLDAFALHEIVVDAQGNPVDYRFLAVNPAFEKLLSRSASQVVGRTMREVLPSTEDSWILRCIEVAQQGKPKRVVEYFRPLDRWFEMVVFSPERGRFGLILQDVTERKAAESEREELEERLRQSEKMDAIGQLAGGVAHDFNNMLAGIMGYGELLRRKLSDSDQRKHAEAIVSAAHRAADLTAKLLAFARKGKVQTVVIDIHALIGEVCSLLEHTIDKRIRLEIQVKAPDPCIQGDPSQIQNALLNLAINARDAMPDGGQLLFSTSEVYLDQEACRNLQGKASVGRYLNIRITDTGTGMSEEVRRRIFEPFFTTKLPGKGTGMGLASVWGTILQHQGAIQVHSVVGHGTEFSIWLPLASLPLHVEVESISECEPLEGRRILVVDDEAMVREATANSLMELGYEVETADGGEAALQLIASGTRYYDLVLLDIIMPGMGGSATFHKLRAYQEDLRILLVSGYSLGGEAQELLNHGAMGFLQKPWDTKQLLHRVTHALLRSVNDSSVNIPVFENPPPAPRD